MERWAEVLGFEGVYEVSDLGRLRRVTERRKQTKLGDFIKTPSRMKSGYLQYVLCLDRKIRSGLAHRLMWEAFRGPIPDGMQLNHLNGDKADNRFDNLEVCTRSENIRHGIYVLKCRRAPQTGENNGAAKLTESAIRSIREMANNGSPAWVIAEAFSVSQATVSMIKSGKRWSSVK